MRAALLAVSRVCSPSLRRARSRAAAEPQSRRRRSCWRRATSPARIASLERIVGASPRSFDARLALGRALDLDGRHADARRQLEEALKLASDDAADDGADGAGDLLRVRGEGRRGGALLPARLRRRRPGDDRGGGGGPGQCARAGSTSSPATCRKRSSGTPPATRWRSKIPELPASQAALWEMRWHNALGRIEARRGNRGRRSEHAAAVKALLDTRRQREPAVFYPYLLGYIAFFAKEYQQAVDELLEGRSDRSVRARPDRAVLREAGRSGEGGGVFPQGDGDCPCTASIRHSRVRWRARFCAEPLVGLLEHAASSERARAGAARVPASGAAQHPPGPDASRRPRSRARWRTAPRPRSPALPRRREHASRAPTRPRRRAAITSSHAT